MYLRIQAEEARRKAEAEAMRKAEEEARRKVLADLLPPHIRTLHKHMHACTHAHTPTKHRRRNKRRN